MTNQQIYIPPRIEFDTACPIHSLFHTPLYNGYACVFIYRKWWATFSSCWKAHNAQWAKKSEQWLFGYFPLTCRCLHRSWPCWTSNTEHLEKHRKQAFLLFIPIMHHTLNVVDHCWRTNLNISDQMCPMPTFPQQRWSNGKGVLGGRLISLCSWI